MARKKVAAEPLPENAKTEGSAKPAEKTPRASASEGMRETIESVVVAFILAFLFRTFEAEAFVIPTGSMAPTLKGRHKDVACTKCGYPYQVSASVEVHHETNARLVDNQGNPLYWIHSAVCPLCRYRMEVGGPGWELPSYNGDRILVGKFAYQVSEPKRWDVVVFKFPDGAHINYIKRLVGLPNETVRIWQGDIYTSKVANPREADFVIERKPPHKLQAMLQIVYDNDFALPSLIEAGWAPRWQPFPAALNELLAAGWQGELPPSSGESPGQWQHSPDYRSFSTDGSAAGETWLRYQHTVPHEENWDWIKKGQSIQATPTLIEDFNAYNRGISNVPSGYDSSAWVGDLVIACELQVGSDTGEAVLELVEGGVPFQCRFDLATGMAQLVCDRLPQLQARVQTAVKGPGSYHVALGNVDDQLLVWVNGKLLEFPGETTYDSQKLGSTMPQPADLAPVGIAAKGARLTVNHLTLHRDIYYIAARHLAPGDKAEGVNFTLGPDQFFVLGDNSAQSQDSRLWERGTHHVDRSLLIGKALFVYWPHSWDHVPDTNIPFPFYPNFSRMGPVK